MFWSDLPNFLPAHFLTWRDSLTFSCNPV